jgi:hypothetical protein
MISKKAELLELLRETVRKFLSVTKNTAGYSSFKVLSSVHVASSTMITKAKTIAALCNVIKTGDKVSCSNPANLKMSPHIVIVLTYVQFSCCFRFITCLATRVV